MAMICIGKDQLDEEVHCSPKEVAWCILSSFPAKAQVNNKLSIKLLAAICPNDNSGCDLIASCRLHCRSDDLLHLPVHMPYTRLPLLDLVAQRSCQNECISRGLAKTPAGNKCNEPPGPVLTMATASSAALRS